MQNQCKCQLFVKLTFIWYRFNFSGKRRTTADDIVRRLWTTPSRYTMFYLYLSALEVFFKNDMRCINSRFTYLLTYLRWRTTSSCVWMGSWDIDRTRLWPSWSHACACSLHALIQCACRRESQLIWLIEEERRTNWRRVLFVTRNCERMTLTAV